MQKYCTKCIIKIWIQNKENKKQKYKNKVIKPWINKGEDVENEMEDILQHFYDINQKLKDKMYMEKADEIFKSIPMKMEQFYDKFDRECMNIPIFKYYDTFQMFQRISCASNEDIVTIREKLVNRVKLYQASGITD